MGSAQAQTTSHDPKLETVVVSGEKRSEADHAKQAQQAIAGAASVISGEDVARGRTSTTEDILAFQPGVFAQAAGGTGAVKISIRGSGVQTSPGYFREGIKFLYDGIPITGPGGTPDEMLNATAVDYTEVLYGANAYKYTALSLGGAINFVTHTGYSSPGSTLHFELGSFGHRKYAFSQGGTHGNADYFVAVQRDERKGFQDGTYNEGKDVVANFGYQFNERLSTRLLLRYREEKYSSGATMTLAQLKDDATANRVISARKKRGSTLIGSSTSYTFDDDSKLELLLGHHNYPHVNNWRYSLQPAYWEWTDFSTTLRYSRYDDRLFGLPSNTTITFSDTRNLSGNARTYNRDTRAFLNHVRYTGSSDTVLAIGNELQLNDRYWLNSGLSLINVRRDVRVPYSASPNLTIFTQEVKRSDSYVAPRLGLRYQLTADAQLFGNISRSIDPPSSWALGGSSTTYVRPLRPQQATTLEVGIKGRQGIFDGSLALYRSWVEDELLTVVLAQATATTEALVIKANASDTIHQGIEAGLSARLWEGTRGDSLTLRQAYTFNDFYYRDDNLYGRNALPGLPESTYQAELQYQHPQGFYAGINVRSASRYYVDYANSLKVPSYTLWGARLGYEAPSQRYKVFLDLRNLTDEDYVTATTPSYDLGGADSTVYYPGDGFGAFTGVTVKF